MIVLHAGFLEGALQLWAEFPREEKPERRKLAEAVEGIIEVKREMYETCVVRMPSAGAAALPSSGLIGDLPASAYKIELLPWHFSTIRLDPSAALPLLTTCVGKQTLKPGVVIAPDLAFWAAAMRFAGALVARQQFLPGLVKEPKRYRAVWKPVLLGHDRERLKSLAAAMPAVARAVTRQRETTDPPSAGTLLISFVSACVDAMVRDACPDRTPAGTLSSIHERWYRALCSSKAVVTGDPEELALLYQQIQDWRQPVTTSLDAPMRLCLRLEEPKEDTDPWFVRYLLQSNSDPSLIVAAKDVASGFNARELLLVSIGQASALCPEINSSVIEAALPVGFNLSATQANQFLVERAMALEQSGFGVLLPSWWSRKGTKRRLTASAHIKSPFAKESRLSLNQLVQFEWKVALGGDPVSMEELKTLADLKAPLVKFRGQWVQLSAPEIQSAIDFWQKRPSGKASVREIVQMALGKPRSAGTLAFEGVTAEGWVDDLLKQLQGNQPFTQLEPPPDLHATLRPYQLRGYSWLAFLRGWGLGACLADDMGLGKTIQTLSLIQADRAAGEQRPVLLVCPTSVVGNWQKEAERFTPELPLMIHHGIARTKGPAFVERAARHALVISSYALLYRDFEILKEVGWAGVVLDEAQNIKNSETKQSAAARAIPAEFRIALTGTPVENNVGDLWSIMEFLNPGFLGTQAEFRKNFFIPIQNSHDAEAAEKLRRLTGPFILRRLKTDRSIISDLPEKMEMKVFCSLTKEQASLYQAVVKDALAAIEKSEGIKRKGVVLATLSKLKQVCNHPAQFLGDNSAIAGRSGKLARLTEMLDEVIEAGDRALVFSQFAEMGELLRKHLQETFGREVLFLHGGTSKLQRDKMVERFQSEQGPPIFLLSLKAGGTGLNLTQASHVFHFDRWWNPAVENQATDRAFRIGQTKNVQVHKFLCAGTLEEKIDEMIESKKELAANVVGSGEGWLTQLSTSELKALFALRKEAVSD